MSENVKCVGNCSFKSYITRLLPLKVFFFLLFMHVCYIDQTACSCCVLTLPSFWSSFTAHSGYIHNLITGMTEAVQHLQLFILLTIWQQTGQRHMVVGTAVLMKTVALKRLTSRHNLHYTVMFFLPKILNNRSISTELMLSSLPSRSTELASHACALYLLLARSQKHCKCCGDFFILFLWWQKEGGVQHLFFSAFCFSRQQTK